LQDVGEKLGNCFYEEKKDVSEQKLQSDTSVLAVSALGIAGENGGGERGISFL